MEERQPRKLAVILHADVVGSTALVQRDEALAHERIQDAFHRFSETIETYNGHPLELRGDALVAEFSRTSDAVEASLAFQAENTQVNTNLEDEIQPTLRIGISLGEVVIADNTITGAGVVLAQRVEQLAEPGGVCITGAIHEAVPQNLPFDQENLGDKKVKGFDEPVRVYAVSLRIGANIPEFERRTKSDTAIPKLPEKPSIAVLPFLNVSRDPEQEYFSDGITEDLIIDLSKISELFVVARNATFSYKGTAVKPEKVARDLGVGYVLEGSVRKAGMRLRITAELIDAFTGGHLWAERYDGELTDVFTLQDEITKQIVTALEVKLTKGEQEQVAKRYTENLDAYDYFLRGRAHQAGAMKEGNVQAREMFEKAIELDPSFAGACAQLSYCHFRDWRYQWSNEPNALELALEAAQTAVVLDDLLPLGHTYLGWALLWKRRHEEAIAEGKRAIALDPNFAEGHARLGEILNLAGRPEEGVNLLKKAMRLDPHYPPIYLFFLGYGYYAMGEYEKAIAALKRSLARNPDHFSPHRTLAVIYSELGRKEEAQAEVTEMLRISPSATLKGQRETMPFRDQAVLERYMGALRDAGVPEG
ncbi:MAG: adenylate/guanylate cyclase domain-containing protein [Gammaproteobacteria bacterium]